MKQTAVEWLAEQMINKMGIRIQNTTIGVELFKQALQMEREQQIALLKFSREMCTPDAPIDYVLNEFNKTQNL